MVNYEDCNMFSYPGLTYNQINKLRYQKVGLRPKKWFLFKIIYISFKILEAHGILFCQRFSRAHSGTSHQNTLCDHICHCLGKFHRQIRHFNRNPQKVSSRRFHKFKLVSWFCHVDQQKVAWHESDFFVGCASYIASTAKRWKISGKFQKHSRNFGNLSGFLEVFGNVQNFTGNFHPFVTLSIATLLTIHNGPCCQRNFAEIETFQKFWNNRIFWKCLELSDFFILPEIFMPLQPYRSLHNKQWKLVSLQNLVEKFDSSLIPEPVL